MKFAYYDDYDGVCLSFKFQGRQISFPVINLLTRSEGLCVARHMRLCVRGV